MSLPVLSYPDTVLSAPARVRACGDTLLPGGEVEDVERFGSEVHFRIGPERFWARFDDFVEILRR